MYSERGIRRIRNAFIIIIMLFSGGPAISLSSRKNETPGMTTPSRQLQTTNIHDDHVKTLLSFFSIFFLILSVTGPQILLLASTDVISV